VDYIRHFSGRLGVITQTAHARIARRRFPQAKIIEYPRWRDVVTAVEQGTVMAGLRLGLCGTRAMGLPKGWA